MSKLVSEDLSNLLRKDIKISLIWFNLGYNDFSEEIGSPSKYVCQFLNKTTKMNQTVFNKYFEALIRTIKTHSINDKAWFGCALSIIIFDLRRKCDQELSPIRKKYTS